MPGSAGAAPARRLALSFFFLLLVVTAGAVRAVTSNAVTVCDPNASCDLQALVNTGGPVLVYGTIVLPATLLISVPVTISGALDAAVPATLSGSHLFRLIQVAAGVNLTLVNLVLTMGTSNAPDVGGAVVLLNANANLVADRCSFVDNFATGSGGAIATLANSVVTLTRCLFQYNSAAQGDGGSIFVQSSTLFMDQCTLLNNAAFYTGGALSAQQSSLYISNSTWMHNSAQRGGAVSAFDAPNHVIFANVFVSNVASFGAAFFVSNNMLAILASSFAMNIADDAASQAIEVSTTSSPTGTTLVAASSFSPGLQAGWSFINLPPLACANASLVASTFPVLGCGTGAKCGAATPVNASLGVTCACPNTPPASTKPIVCSSQPYHAAQPPPQKPCLTSGGYVDNNTPCVFPFTVTTGSGKNVKSYTYTSCQPVVPGLPYESTPPHNGTANSFWCSTVAKYSPDSADTSSRKMWGYCGTSCGYADPATSTTASPTTLAPTSQPTPMLTLVPTPAQGKAPLLVLARYGGSDGSRIELYFDRSTNCGGGTNCAGALMPCLQLLVVNLATDMCQWISTNTLYMYPSYPYVNVTLLSTVIANPWGGPPFASGSLPVIGGGTLLGSPLVIIIAPANISRCASLTLDASQSLVTTLGGIQKLQWTLQSVSPPYSDATQLTQALANCTTLVCTVGTLPYPGVLFDFSLTLTNWFLVSSAATATVTAVDDHATSQAALSIVFAAGSSVQAPMSSSTAAASTNIAAVVRLVGCGNVPMTSRGLSLQWTVNSPAWVNASTVLVPTLDPWVTTFNPNALDLGPANPLPLSVVVGVTASADLIAPASAQITVHVVQTPLVVSILNANCTVSVNNSYLLYGAVTSGARLAQESLTFTWACVVVRGAQGETCAVQVSGIVLSEPTTSRALLPVNLPDRRYTIELQVRSSARPGVVVTSRAYIATSSSSSSSAVEVLAASRPASAFVASRVRATGTCPLSLGGLPSWNVTDDASGTAVSILAIVLQGVVLPSTALSGGSSYVFQIDCTDNAVSQGVLSVNLPPSLGSVQVSPESGSVTGTLFTLSTSGWDADNLPLRFVFSGIDANDNEFALTALTSWNEWEILLPYQTNGAVARAMDALGALSAPTNATTVYVGLPDDANTWFINQIPIWISDTQFVQRSGGLILAEVAMAVSILDFVDALSNVTAVLTYAVVSMLVVASDAMILDWTTSQAFSQVLVAMPADFTSSLDADSARVIVGLLLDGQGVPESALKVLSRVASDAQPLNLTCAAVDTGDALTNAAYALAQMHYCAPVTSSSSGGRRSVAASSSVADSTLTGLDNLAAQVLIGALSGEPSFVLASDVSHMFIWPVNTGAFELLAGASGVTVHGTSSGAASNSVWVTSRVVDATDAPLADNDDIVLSDVWSVGGTADISALAGIRLAVTLTATNLGPNLFVFTWTADAPYIATLACQTFTGRNCTAAAAADASSVTCACELDASDHVFAVGLRAVPLVNFTLTSSPTPPDRNPLAPSDSTASFEQGWAACLVLLTGAIACALVLVLTARLDARETATYDRGLALVCLAQRMRDRKFQRMALSRMCQVVADNVRLTFEPPSSADSTAAAPSPRAPRNAASSSSSSSRSKLPSWTAVLGRSVAARHPWLAPLRAFEPRRPRVGKLALVVAAIFVNAGAAACFLTLIAAALPTAWVAAAAVSAVCTGVAVWLVDGAAAMAGALAERRRSKRRPVASDTSLPRAPMPDELAIKDDPARKPASDATAAAALRPAKGELAHGALQRAAPLLSFAVAGALLAVVWNLSVAGEGLVGLWLQTFALALALDVVVVESLLAALRLALSLAVRARLRRPRRTAEGNGAVVQASPGARWVAQPRHAGEEDALVVMLVDVASMDSDAEARGLLNMILGESEGDDDDMNGAGGGGGGGGRSSDGPARLETHYHVPGDTDSSQGGALSRPQSRAESLLSAYWVDDDDDHGAAASQEEHIVGEMLV